jgi:hypothetical protein
LDSRGQCPDYSKLDFWHINLEFILDGVDHTHSSIAFTKKLSEAASGLGLRPDAADFARRSAMSRGRKRLLAVAFTMAAAQLVILVGFKIFTPDSDHGILKNEAGEQPSGVFSPARSPSTVFPAPSVIRDTLPPVETEDPETFVAFVGDLQGGEGETAAQEAFDSDDGLGFGDPDVDPVSEPAGAEELENSISKPDDLNELAETLRLANERSPAEAKALLIAAFFTSDDNARYKALETAIHEGIPLERELLEEILINDASELVRMTAFQALSVYFESHGEDIQELIDLSVRQGDSLLADFALDFEEAWQLPAATTASDDEPEVE